jgi:hypothetical protein
MANLSSSEDAGTCYIHSEQQQQPSAVVKHMHSTLLQLSCLVSNENQNFSPHLEDIIY